MTEKIVGRIVSVNVGRVGAVLIEGEAVPTALVKSPVGASVRATALGMFGDKQANPAAHGGPNKAVYGYPVESYAHWRERLAMEIPLGHLGENLSVEGWEETDAAIGDVFAVGGAVFQITRPRSPCAKLRAHLRQPAAFLRDFGVSGRSGYYLRVLQEGDVRAGDPVRLIRPAKPRVTVADLAIAMADPAAHAGTIRAALALPGIDDDFRESLSKRLR